MPRLTVPETIKRRLQTRQAKDALVPRSLGRTSSHVNTDIEARSLEDTLRHFRQLMRNLGVDVDSAAGTVEGVSPAVPVVPPVLAKGVHGDFIIRGVKGWKRLGAGTSGQLLATQGTGKEAKWL